MTAEPARRAPAAGTLTRVIDRELGRSRASRRRVAAAVRALSRRPAAVDLLGAPPAGTRARSDPFGEWVYGPRVADGTGAILCLAPGSPRARRGLAARLSAAAGMPALAAAPGSADGALAAYRWLLEGDRQVVIAAAGDGARPAVALAAAVHWRELTAPAGLALLSPLADPARVEAAAMPPTLIQAGGTEAGGAEALAAAIPDCTLQAWPGQPDGFHALHRLLPEARAALDQAGRFAGARLTRTGSPTASPSAGRAPARARAAAPR